MYLVVSKSFFDILNGLAKMMLTFLGFVKAGILSMNFKFASFLSYEARNPRFCKTAVMCSFN